MVAELTADELPHRDAWKRTPFLLAVTAGNIEVAQALLEKGGDLHAGSHCGAPALHLAAANGHCHRIEWLLAKGFPLDARDDFDHSALHAAVSANCVNAAALLLQQGADFRERDDNGYGLIHAVPLTEDLAMLKLLLQAGVDVNATDCDGWTCLFHLRSQSVADYLLEHGADPRIAGQSDGLPEDWASIPLSIRQKLKAARMSMTS